MNAGLGVENQFCRDVGVRMKPGDHVKLKSNSKHTPQSAGVILDVLEHTDRLGNLVVVRWQNQTETQEILKDFVHFYEVTERVTT